jgi:CPA1 family monovalent cation:H+ antiporter
MLHSVYDSGLMDDRTMVTKSARFDLVINVIILVILVSLVTQIFHFPFTVALVFAGVLVSFLAPNSLPQLSPEIFLTLLLPPLIFQAATRINISDLQKDGKIVLSYAFVGTVSSALLVGLLSNLFLGFSLSEGLLLGAIVSPTDPTAVISTLRKLRLNRRLAMILEGESLFNDGVAVVMYSTIVMTLRSGIVDPIGVTEGILISLLMGAAVGGIVGYISYKVISVVDERFVQIMLTFVCMYGSYQTAAYLRGSGIIAVAVAGIVMGNLMRNAIPKKTIEGFDTIWEFVSFFVTCLSFILIGMDLNLSLFGNYMTSILLSIAIVLVARIITVYGLSAALNFRNRILSRNWQNIIIWSGLRGAVSVMLVLGLATLPITHGKELIAITFGVVFFSVLFQGSSIGFLIKRLTPQELPTTEIEN